MATEYAKLKRRTASTKAGLGLVACQWGYSPEFKAIHGLYSDGTTEFRVYTHEQYSRQDGFSGASLIGCQAITGITPDGYAFESTSELMSMLRGIVTYAGAGSVGSVAITPASSTRNIVQPSGDYVPLRLRGHATQTTFLQTWDSSAGTALAYVDSHGRIVSSASYAGNSMAFAVNNLDNTSAASHAILQAGVGGSSSGDPYVSLSVAGGASWSWGIDNSVSGDPLVISASASLGASNVMSITTAGAVAIPGALSVGSSGTFTLDYMSAARVPFAGAGGTLTSSSNLTYTTGTTTFATANGTFSGTLGVTGIQTNAAAITFNGAGSAADWSVFRSAGAGLAIRGGAGSTYDFSIFSPAGSYLIRNPTGGTVLELPGSSVIFSNAPTISSLSAGRMALISTGGLVAQDSIYWATGGFIGIGSGASTVTSELLIAKSSTSSIGAAVFNSNNSNAAAHARILIGTGGGSGGDPYVYYNVSGGADWALGIDNTDSDAFVLAASSTPGTSNIQRWTSAGSDITGTLGVTGLITATAGVSWAADLVFSATNGIIRANTADGLDNKTLRLAGGGAYSSGGTRGAGIELFGNEAAGGGGSIEISAGELATAQVSVRVMQNQSYAFKIYDRAGGDYYFYVDTNTSNRFVGIPQKMGIGGTFVTAAALPSTPGQDCPDTGATPCYIQIKKWNGTSWDKIWLNCVPNKVIP